MLEIQFWSSLAISIAIVLATWTLIGILAGPPIGRLLKRANMHLEDDDE